MQNIQMLLIDANKLFREGLKRLLDGSPFTVAAEADSPEEGMALLGGGLSPTISMVELDGNKDHIETIIGSLKADRDLKVVVLASLNLSIHDMAKCFEAGADGYLLKNISPQALEQCLNLVLLGEKVFPTRLASLLISGKIDTQRGAGGGINGLSERETQILRCLLNGHPNKVIAKKLNITEATVKVHLKGVLKKINAANRTQAAIWALNHGLGAEGAPPPAVVAERAAGPERSLPPAGGF